MVMPVLLSLCFALAFLVFSYMQETQTSAQIFEAAGQRFLMSPWRQHPKSTIHDVRGGREVYEWLEQVFLQQLYMETPEDGSAEAYCTKSHPCRLNEGNVNSDSECSGPLVAGYRNCPSRLGSRRNCCQQCVGDTCPEQILQTKEINLTANTSVEDLSASCANTLPPWLSLFARWKAKPEMVDTASVNVSFCPERVGTTRARGLMVGRFNRALMGRITLKRRKLISATSPVFSNAYGKVTAAAKTDAWSHRPSEEDMSPFGSYHYKKDDGFNRAGGFVELLNFDEPKKVTSRKISALKREGWFDLNQGSMVVELLLWNGNVELLTHVAFAFEHQFSGMTDVRVLVNSLSFNIHDFNLVSTYVRIFIYIVIIVCFVFFFRSQIEDISADYKQYFSEPMGYIHLGVVVLCAYVIVIYLTIIFSYAYLNFNLPMEASEFADIAELSMNNQDLKVVIAVVTCLLFVQAVAECTNLVPQLRLLVDSMAVMSNHLVTFFVLLFLMILGFGLAGMFLMGFDLGQFRSADRSILTVVEMIRGKANYDVIVKADDRFGDSYYLSFQFFFLIFQQFLLTILMTGYLKERKRMAESEQVETPLRRIFRSIKSSLQHASANVRSRIISLQQIFFGAGQGTRNKTVDYDQVARLRDRRATQQRIRNIVYEKRPGNDADDIDISEDVFLRAVDPFYPDGMMHYYVQGTAPEGVAQDYKVQGFRLVGIFSKGNYDREKFRSQERLEQNYKKNPQEILKELSHPDCLPVRLEFQGKVRPWSCECIIVALLGFIFVIFVLQVTRVVDSYSLGHIHRIALLDNEWYEYHPTRIMDFRNMSLVPRSFSSWMKEAIFEGELGCVGTDESSKCAGESASAANMVRENWQLYVHSTSSEDFLKLRSLPELAGLDMVNTHPDPEGMVAGFVPKSSSLKDVGVRLRNWNVAVMPNNQMRMIMQTGCYREVKNERFNIDYPYSLDHSVRNCASSDCMGHVIATGRTCYTFDGDPLNLREQTGAYSGLKYSYTENKGIVIGLGSTPAEAKTVWDIVSQDQLKPVAMTLEFVTYNGNMDMFSHARVKLELQPSGLLERNIEVVVFPLNVFNMGLTDFADQRTSTNRALFITYLIATLLFLCWVLRDLLIQLQLTSMEKPWYMFIPDYFMDDFWNTVDVACLVINAFVIDSIFRYILIDSSFSLKEGFGSWTLDYQLTDVISTSTTDSYEEFGRAADLYARFQTLSALNGLLLVLRFAKYFRCVSSLRLVLATLAAAVSELVSIAAALLIVLVAVVILLHTRFGLLFERYATLEDSSRSIFLFLTGYFDTDDLFHMSPLFFLFVTVIFQITILLILNLFVSAIIYRWKDTRRDAEEFSITGFFSVIKDNLNFLKGSKAAARAQEDRSLTRLDAKFWKKMGVLPLLDRLDETGKILPDEPSGKLEEEEQREEEASEGESSAVDQKRFVTVFKKAHMEIASQMTRDISEEAEAAQDLDLDYRVLHRWELEDMSQEKLGIIEDPQMPSTMDYISNKMNQELDQARPAEEIWLDALITVLEEANALEKLQKLFLPMPMIQPKKVHEWSLFKHKKIRMERRLNSFLRWLQEEARVQHYQFVREMAVSKERVLKQQSLVLSDYLQTLDEQIQTLQQEMESLETRNSLIRAKVSPLL